MTRRTRPAPRQRPSLPPPPIERLESRYLFAAAAAPAFDVLVFSRTAAFRHDSVDEGIAAIGELGAANDFAVVATEDPAAFNDANLARFEAVVFLSTTGDVLDASQQAAFERYIAAGNGFVGVHAAADTEYAWPWYGGLVGAYFRSHPSIQPATIKVADRAHPATAGLPERWSRTDEWYNYQLNPRGNVHVLATLDERTYSPGTGAMGADHPIAWCHAYGGGRSFYTGIGHTPGTYAEPFARQHLLGGIRYAAGAAAADDGATVNANYRKVVLDADTVNPMSMDVAADGRVFVVERGGAVKVYDPRTAATTVAATIPVVTTDEDGLQGIALDPNFAANNWVYLFYSATPAPANEQRVSRFTLGGNGLLDLASERILIRIPVDRSGVNHSAGSLDFGPDGTLYISTGDNTNPFESNGYAPIDERPGRSKFDAQRSSGNTNDLRGKILRVTPQADGTYAVPAGNLFPGGVGGRAEVYVMGNRNPFRISVDQETGWLYWGEVGPDSNSDSATRGPRGHDEFNQARSAGNYGWPHFIGDNKPYIDFTFPSGPSGTAFDPAAPVNNSPNNTGATTLPPARPAWIWYPYGSSSTFPELDPSGGGRTAMGGPVYHYDPASAAPNALPRYYDDTVFIYEWSRNWIREVKLDGAGNPLKINAFLPSLSFRRPMDMEVGPDGVMYILEWGSGFGGGNADSQLVRIDYVRGVRPPAARASADRDSGATPLSVQFSSAGTDPGDRGPVTYAWDFDNNGTTDSTAADPTFTYSTPGNYTARLVVTDAADVTSAATVQVTVGNTRPDVTLSWPLDGSFFAWGQHVPYWAAVTDAEDGSTAGGQIAPASVVVQPYTGHNDHSHPLDEYPGLSGVIPVADGHGDGADDLYYVVEARHTDAGGAGGSRPLTGRAVAVLQPRRKQAEHFSSAAGVVLVDAGDADGGGSAVGSIDNGDAISFRPVNLRNINRLRYRVSTAAAGARLELRRGSPTGPQVSEVVTPATGGAYATVTATVTDPGGTHELFLVFRGSAAGLAGMKLNWIEFDRANNAAPAAAADAYQVAAGLRLEIASAQGALANDADGQGDALFAGLTAGPANGTVTFHPDGSFVYAPNTGFAGTDSFTYFAHDGVFPSAPATVTVRVVARPAVQTVQINDGSAQRSRITSLTVTFAEPVALGAGAFTLSGRNGSGAGTLLSWSNPAGDGRAWELRFGGGPTLGGGLADGVYDLTVVAGQIRSAELPAAVMTADHGSEFHRLYSDADGDGDSDNADLFQFRTSYGKAVGDPAYRWYFDYDNDGDVDNADLFQVRSRRGIEYKGY